MNHKIIVFVIKQYASAILTRHQVSSAVIVTQTAQSYETLARVSQTSQISFENLTVSLSHSNSLHVKLCLTFSDVTRLTYTSPAKSICFYLFLVPFSLEMQTAIFFCRAVFKQICLMKFCASQIKNLPQKLFSDFAAVKIQKLSNLPRNLIRYEYNFMLDAVMLPIYTWEVGKKWRKK